MALASNRFMNRDNRTFTFRGAKLLTEIFLVIRDIVNRR